MKEVSKMRSEEEWNKREMLIDQIESRLGYFDIDWSRIETEQLEEMLRNLKRLGGEQV